MAPELPFSSQVVGFGFIINEPFGGGLDGGMRREEKDVVIVLERHQGLGVSDGTAMERGDYLKILAAGSTGLHSLTLQEVKGKSGSAPQWIRSSRGAARLSFRLRKKALTK